MGGVQRDVGERPREAHREALRHGLGIAWERFGKFRRSS